MFYNTLLFLGIYLFVFAKTAHAYIDPGTGSYITQLAIGFLFGGGYLLKIFWSKISKFLRSIFGKFNKNEEKKETN